MREKPFVHEVLPVGGDRQRCLGRTRLLGRHARGSELPGLSVDRSLLDRRMPRVPVGRTLVDRTGAAEQRFVEVPSDQL